MARSLLLPGDRPLVNLGLVAATLVTTVGCYFVFNQNSQGDFTGPLAYGFCAVLILGTHEMGHYVLARIHGVQTTLPYFIPFPLSFGTLGAVIRIKSRIPSRNALVDIGAAGPLAGVAVAIPVILWGLSMSTVADAPPGTPVDWSLVALAKDLIRYVTEQMAGTWQPHAVGPMPVIYGDNLLMRGLQWLVLGPLPPGKEVYVHPVVIAGWFGLLVTMLNLCPIGQLDGGHLAFAVFGRRAELMGRLVSAGLLYLALFHSASWIVWFAVTASVIGFGHPPVLHPEEPLTRSRKLVCAICLIVLVLCIVPIPMQAVQP
ncbi:MAG: site-2 protease family protein [Myxococcaceae bacterium]|nr:site-2 protease family protein [Myxococcaceae bacterium]